MNTNTQGYSNAGQGLGIAGLILGIIAFIIAFIPCIGILALIPGIVAIILSAVAYSQVNRSGGTKGLVIAALVVSILGTSVAAVWGLLFTTTATIFHKIDKEVKKETGKNLKETFDEFGDELEKTLDELENEGITVEEMDKAISNEDFDKLINAYEGLITDYLKIVDKAKEGDLAALTATATVSIKATAIAAKLAVISDNLTDEQKEKFDKVKVKYEKAFKELEEAQKDQ